MRPIKLLPAWAVMLAMAMTLPGIGTNAQSLQRRDRRHYPLRTDSVAKVTQPGDSAVMLDSLVELTDTLLFPQVFYLPVVYDKYDPADSTETLGNWLIRSLDKPSAKDAADLGSQAFYWLDRQRTLGKWMRRVKQKYMLDHPEMVSYNAASLPKPPKEFHRAGDPQKNRIDVGDIVIGKEEMESDVEPVEIKHRNWLYDFNGSMQFSQAYISPNWYQGGSNNLNMIVNAVYNISLNQAFYPKLLFDTTVKYKLAMSSAPEDSLRSYSISEDLFQVNSKFGVKAFKQWFYSVQLQFKTQFLSSYTTNTDELVAAFLSPSELNIGLGMTYSYTHPKERATFDASISPVSYNLKTSTNHLVDQTTFGIDQGKRTVNQIGSSAECKLNWKITRNISLLSTLYMFTDYDYIQGDWENTLSFTINRYLSTQIYAHLRYDSTTDRIENSNWHKLQLKEILSFGFAYTIANN